MPTRNEYDPATEKVSALECALSALERELELEDAMEKKSLLASKNATLADQIAEGERISEVFLARLQDTEQELQSTEEELQSAREELQSAGEELQSTKKELQSAREELQRTEEELQNVLMSSEEQLGKKAASNRLFMDPNTQEIMLKFGRSQNKLLEAEIGTHFTMRLSGKDSGLDNDQKDQVANLKLDLNFKEYLLETLSRGGLELVTELRDKLKRAKEDLSKKEEKILEVQAQRKSAEETVVASSQALQMSEKRLRELQHMLDEVNKEDKLTESTEALKSETPKSELRNTVEDLLGKLKYVSEALEETNLMRDSSAKDLKDTKLAEKIRKLRVRTQLWVASNNYRKDVE